jgi:hypothetical protein
VGSSAKGSTGEHSSTLVNRSGNVTGLYLPVGTNAAEYSEILTKVLRKIRGNRGRMGD